MSDFDFFAKNSQIIFLMPIFTTRGVLTPKLWAPLNPAHKDTSFGTLQSPIGHTVPEIMAEISKKLSDNCFNVNFHHQGGGADPKVMGTVEFGSSRRFFWHLAKSDWTYGSGDIKTII